MRKAFTLLELVFVIVIIGILAKFGTNILMTTYEAATSSSVNNKLLADTELTLKQLSNRLQYRIKPSVISRAALNGAFVPVANAAAGDTVLEWIGYDIDGWLGSAGSTNPTWSGFIDVNDAGAIASQIGVAPYLESPGTSTALITATITALNNSAVSVPAIFFTGENANVNTHYGWNGAVAGHPFTAAHPVTGGGATATQLVDSLATSFVGTDVYENYKLAWSAYAVSLEDGDADGTVDDLVLYYDYQPWNGGVATAGIRRQLLLQNVDTFKYVSVGDTLKIEVCVNDQNALADAAGGYSVCEEIAIF